MKKLFILTTFFCIFISICLDAKPIKEHTKELSLDRKVENFINYSISTYTQDRANAFFKIINSKEEQFTNIIPGHLVAITSRDMTEGEKEILNELKILLNMERFKPLKQRLSQENILIYCAVVSKNISLKNRLDFEGMNFLVGEKEGKRVGFIVLKQQNSEPYTFTENLDRTIHFHWFPICSILNELYELLERTPSRSHTIFNNTEFQTSSLGIDSLWKVVIASIIKEELENKNNQFTYSSLSAKERDKLIERKLAQMPERGIYSSIVFFKTSAHNAYKNLHSNNYLQTQSESELTAKILNQRLKDYLGTENIQFVPEKITETEYKLNLKLQSP